MEGTSAVPSANPRAGRDANANVGAGTMAVKTTVKKYKVDVCHGGCYALFPDGTVRAFRDKPECLEAIKTHHDKRRVGKNEIAVSVIEWSYRDRTVTEKL